MDSARPSRLEAIDLLRGLVMIIMALDHVRDFMSDRLLEDPVDMKTTTPALFLTRFITHYCAPTFIFLAGTSAFLSGNRGKSKRDLSIFLLTRGLWLAIFEITLCRALWMFNYDWYVYGAGVFWAIGWSMIALAGLIHLPLPVIATFGLAMIASHNLLDSIPKDQTTIPRILWVNLHQQGETPLYEGSRIIFDTGYCWIPWIGVMAVGYAFGSFYLLPQNVRRRWLLGIGLTAIAAFIIIRGMNVYGDKFPWQKQDSVLMTCLSFLNCWKYPPSLLYLLVTLGPVIVALSLFDRPLPRWTAPIITFGKVPLFYYILHIILIHGGAVAIDYVRFGWSPLATSPPWLLTKERLPPNYGLTLPQVYLVWVVIVLALYYPCQWYAGVKARNRSVWLSYL